MCKTLMTDDEPLKRCKKCGGVEFVNRMCKNCKNAAERCRKKELRENSPEVWAMSKAAAARRQKERYQNDQEYRAMKKAVTARWQKERYLNDAEYRATKNAADRRREKDRYQNDSEYRAIRKKKEGRNYARKKFEHLLGGMLRLQEQETQKPENPQPTENRD